MIAAGHKQITVGKQTFSVLRMLEGMLNESYKSIVERLAHAELERVTGADAYRLIAEKNQWNPSNESASSEADE